MRDRARLPFDPARVPVFYGWVILAVATLGILASIPGQTMGVSVFTDPLMEATELSRLAVARAYLVGTLASGLTLPWAGVRVDRLGARAAGLLAAAGLGLTLVYMSQVDRIAQLGGGGPLAAATALTLGFFGLRFTGQGVLTMVSRTMIGRWFDRRRGLASGMSGVVVGFGFGSAPRLLDAWIQAATWRGAWLEMGLAVALGMGLVIVLFYRNDPESVGLRMDGRADPKSSGPDDRPPAELAFTRTEAIRTLAFWAITLGLATHALIITGITFHIVDIGRSAGLDRSASVALFLPMAAVSTLVALVGGAIGDRLPVRVLLLVMLVALAVGAVGAADLEHGRTLLVAGLGTGGGLFSPVATLAYPRFFGRRHLGAIVGVEMMVMVLASALGPALLAASESRFGSYGPSLHGAVGLLAGAAVLVLLFPSPRKPR